MTEVEEEPKFGVDYLHPCALHGEDEGWYKDDESIPACPDCGIMLATGCCIWCGATWLEYGVGGDDTIAAAVVTEYGEVVCCRCAEEEFEDELAEDYYEDSESK